jgi:hypothetical protein
MLPHFTHRLPALPGNHAHRRHLTRGFTIVESLLMLVLLTMLTMVSVALWIKKPAQSTDDDLRWSAEGGDATKLTPALPVAEDPDLAPNLNSDLESRLEKPAPEAP